MLCAGKSTLYKTNDAENITTSTWDNLGTLASGEYLKTLQPRGELTI